MIFISFIICKMDPLSASARKFVDVSEHLSWNRKSPESEVLIDDRR